MSIREIILFEIRKKLNFEEKIIMGIFKEYTLKVYKMGYDDCYNWKHDKVDTVNEVSTIVELN